jgi:hypothetical protein
LDEEIRRWRILHRDAIGVENRKVDAGVRPDVCDECGKRLIAGDMPARVEPNDASDSGLDHVNSSDDETPGGTIAAGRQGRRFAVCRRSVTTIISAEHFASGLTGNKAVLP